MNKTSFAPIVNKYKYKVGTRVVFSRPNRAGTNGEVYL